LSEPIVFISHLRIKEGKLDAYRQFSREMTPLLEAEKPRTLAFLAYLNEDATQVTNVHVCADADAMDVHLQGVEGRAGSAMDFLELEGYEIYGTPSDRALEMMQQFAKSLGGELIVKSEHLGGFLRLKSS
jgi:hypothetical protein